jgi:tRNA (guanine-N7-)-methyltransferase
MAHRNFYGRIKGKTLTAAQQRYLNEDLPRLSVIGITFDENPDRSPLDIFELAGGRKIWLEVGFGGGEHLVHQALQNPDIQFLGVEPYVNGVAMLLGKIRRVGVNNIKLYMGDARNLMDVLPDESINRAFLLYPDPWPKLRHHRRRFVTSEHLIPLNRCLKAGAEFRVATDIEDYVRQTLIEAPQAGFEWLAEGPENWRTPWVDWVSTRYELKALREDRTPHYMTFRKS